uniref:Uncharacterized protein n=1 Tax=Anguilla anguilla TaxID=7936 RepID=A0A0E9WCA8_ANGAN
MFPFLPLSLPSSFFLSPVSLLFFFFFLQSRNVSKIKLKKKG